LGSKNSEAETCTGHQHSPMAVMQAPKQSAMVLDSMLVMQVPKQADMEGGIMLAMRSDEEQLITQWPHPRLLGGGDGDSLDNSKITVFSACCCCYSGCVKAAGSIGCMTSETICCLESECCCKTGSPCLGCGCCCLRCVKPAVCIKLQSQCCCCASAAAFPCDEEVPCLVGTCCLVCYPKFGCCKTVGYLTGKGGEGGGPAAETVGAEA